MNDERSKYSWLLVVAGVLLMIIFAIIASVGLDTNNQPRIGFVMTGAVTDAGWNGMNYNGISAACDKLNAKLYVEENILEGTGQCAEAIHRLAKKGAEMIILTSFGYPSEVKDVIASYPDIAFYSISSENEAVDMTCYFGRVYQARYLAGIVAAMTTNTNSLGYVAAMPNSEVNRGINAFTLGAKSVSPDAQVNVIFTGSWDDEEKERKATQRLIAEHGTDVLTYHQNKHTVAYTADEAGVYSIGYNEAISDISEKYLTATVWNWSELYYRIIREHLYSNTSIKRYWLGIDTGVVGLSDYSPLVTEDIRLAVEEARASIAMGNNIFYGTIYDNTGVLRCSEDEMLSDATLFNNMDWYVDGVVIYE